MRESTTRALRTSRTAMASETLPNGLGEPALLTVDEVARLLKCCPRTVRRRIAEGELKALRIRPRAVRISLDALKLFIEKASAGD